MRRGLAGAKGYYEQCPGSSKKETRCEECRRRAVDCLEYDRAPERDLSIVELGGEGATTGGWRRSFARILVIST